MVMDKIALLLVIIGAVNWGLIGIFQFDLVASIFGGQAAVSSTRWLARRDCGAFRFYSATVKWSRADQRQRKRRSEKLRAPF